LNRKDDHINHALKQTTKANDFDKVRFIHNALSGGRLEDVDLSSQFCENDTSLPIYINAMTGGSEQAAIINIKLAKLANHFNIPMALGSVSAALKDTKWEASFRNVRTHYPNGFLLANLGAEHLPQNAQKALDLIKGDALQIHLNAVQELIMPEGDRDFSQWETNIQALVRQLNVPLIIKEVGFGVSLETALKLKTLGVQHIDVSGRGGTNFSVIENARRTHQYESFNDWGLSTVESLLEMRNIDNMHIYASGGIRGALDIVKALRLGAEMVGLSGYFLHLVTTYDLEEAIEHVATLIDEIRAIFCALGVHNIATLRSVPFILTPDLDYYVKARTKQ